MANISGEDPTVQALDPTTPSAPAGGEQETAGACVGRYQIGRTLGRGGMGTVYEAYDPQLDRKVALKLVRAGHNSTPEALIGEAKALAQLDDRHVVQVYDAGEHGDDVFIAMQLVEGEDLATALAKRQPKPAQILAWFVDAGRGLAAAHTAGLVHRDFKPSNVLIDRRGRVAVTDFGLAVRTRDGAPGGFAGTPVYMAPEQHALEPATEASDQFAFCVALWEALFKTHPYVRPDSARSLAEVGAAITNEPLVAPSRDNRISRRVVDALQRGLARDPGARWPNMAALLGELAPKVKRKMWPIVAIGVGAAAIGGVGVWLYARSDTPSCAVQAKQRVATVWSEQRKTEIAAQFARSGRSYAASTAKLVAAELDSFAARWEEQAAGACGHEDLLVRRRACLDANLDRMHAEIDVLSTATADVVDHAADLTAHLPDLASCADPAVADAPAAASAPEVARLNADIERVRSRMIAGATGELPRARELLARATQIGWAPAIARAHIAVGVAESNTYRPAIDELVKGAELAVANHLDRDAIAAWQAAIEDAGHAGKEDLVTTFTAAAHSAADRLHDPRVALEVDIYHARALIRLQKWDEGLAICQPAIAVAEKLGARHAAEGARDCVFEAYVPSGRTAELRPVAAQRIASTIERLGPDAPELITYETVLADADASSGDIKNARIEIDRAGDVLAKAYRGDNNIRTEVMQVRGKVELGEGKGEQGLQTLRDALVIAKAIVPTPVVDIAQIQTALATMLVETDPDGAMRAFEDAIATARAQGPDSMALAMLLLNYGQVTAQTDFDSGLRAFAEAKQILDQHHDARAHYATAAMAAVEANHKRWRDALVHAEDAVEFSKTDPSAEPINTAELEFVVAQGLVETRGDKKRAHALAVEARATLLKLGPPAAPYRKAIERWLRTH